MVKEVTRRVQAGFLVCGAYVLEKETLKSQYANSKEQEMFFGHWHKANTGWLEII